MKTIKLARSGSSSISSGDNVPDRSAATIAALEARCQALAAEVRDREAIHALQIQKQKQEIQDRETRLFRLTYDLAQAQREGHENTRKIALEAIRLMDALDWVQEALTARGAAVKDLSRELASAQRDCLRRLAAAGIEEIPATGRMDGHLHEGLEVVPADAAGGVPKYDIVRVLRRGWKQGAEVLRRAGVATAG
jgi:molecular chaperone GrpE (heat shock protein)